MGPDGPHGDIEDHPRPACSVRSTARSNRSPTTSVSIHGVGIAAVLTTPLIMTWTASMLWTRAIEMKMRCGRTARRRPPADPRRVAPPALDDVAHLSDLVTGAVEHRQTPDPGDEDRRRGRRCARAVSQPLGNWLMGNATRITRLRSGSRGRQTDHDAHGLSGEAVDEMGKRRKTMSRCRSKPARSLS